MTSLNNWQHSSRHGQVTNAHQRVWDYFSHPKLPRLHHWSSGINNTFTEHFILDVIPYPIFKIECILAFSGKKGGSNYIEQRCNGTHCAEFSQIVCHWLSTWWSMFMRPLAFNCVRWRVKDNAMTTCGWLASFVSAPSLLTSVLTGVRFCHCEMYPFIIHVFAASANLMWFTIVFYQ